MASFFPKKGIIWLTVIASVAFVFHHYSNGFEPKVDYNAEVKPILNKHCLSCHGGVRRKSGFSLLTREDALSNAESGKPAIVPGHTERSEFIRRLTLDDPEERMPYGKEPLTEAEISILTKWVDEGAQWDLHWAYRPVEKPPVPGSERLLSGLGEKSWGNNEVDAFILDKLLENKLVPSTSADKATLLRRVSLDLIGMPAPENLAIKYLDSNSPITYEQLVDSLLALPQYGERWTAMWLDLARYADTKGYERDDRRQIWRYRDWLIKAFNDDMPYDQFLTEQLAGDLLGGDSHPTDNQYVATAFHRNTMTNDEGGTDNEEFRTAAVIDRVNTTWEAFMGTTFACVQCHDHPYDPFRHDEYYQFMAFFNNTRDADTYEDYPQLRHFAKEDSLRLIGLTERVKKEISPEKAAEVYTFLKTLEPVFYSLETDSLKNAALYDTKWLGLRQHGSARLRGVDLNNVGRLWFRYQGMMGGGRWTVRLDSPTGEVLFSTILKETKGWFIEKLDFPMKSGKHDLWFSYENPKLKPDAAGVQFDWCHFAEPGFGDEPSIKPDFDYLLRVAAATTPVMVENMPEMKRPTHLFERGNWLVKGRVVEAGVPKILPPMPSGVPQNRLGLAQWMTAPAHPLTARTMVNRLWEQLFGNGLAETLEDLGSQGIPPTHRELLDWLAYNFMHEQGWSTKKLLKTLVMSATYRQDSKVSAQALEADPYNHFYARGPRVRLSAEQIRDQALSIAGVLNPKMYGPSVMPHQPDGVWKSPWNGDDWKLAEGDERYRRAVYTFLKRTGPYPAMITFDGVAREVCTARRVRTNTPLQALVTLNDEAYVVAARYFANRIFEKKLKTPNEQLALAYLIATGHEPDAAKTKVLLQLYERSHKDFAEHKEKMEKICGAETMVKTPEIAALVVVANAVLNLDDVLTKS
ncbi:MAG: DUF1553 domain-containing protein [Saprospiraceae bacterium]|nr:DUF1553 domain-containing protein [Saprospiraceae bacterium]MCF8248551.1 DUF1553 domain-containing protein [Saprospiraceae bacterium]MCF8310285.1 DUF1553 domain-containing protein [Saprospiraceae bacterium]MCF8439276.1 DUF1553 domain-containing protein [Saprospiraceae bacterium]